jgi:hypothetical protein
MREILIIAVAEVLRPHLLGVIKVAAIIRVGATIIVATRQLEASMVEVEATLEGQIRFLI